MGKSKKLTRQHTWASGTGGAADDNDSVALAAARQGGGLRNRNRRKSSAEHIRRTLLGAARMGVQAANLPLDALRELTRQIQHKQAVHARRGGTSIGGGARTGRDGASDGYGYGYGYGEEYGYSHGYGQGNERGCVRRLCACSARRFVRARAGCGRLLKRSRAHPVVRQSMAAIESTAGSVAIFLITLYALFGDDARLAAAPKSADDAFFACASVVLALFVAELILTSLGKDGYFHSFNFYLDAVATGTLVLDIGWIMQGADDGSSRVILVDRSGQSSGGYSTTLDSGSVQNLDQSRNARILRLVRLVRLVRVAKLWRVVTERQKSKHEQREAATERALQRFVEDFTMDDLLERFSIADSEGYGRLTPQQMKYLLMSTLYANAAKESATKAREREKGKGMWKGAGGASIGGGKVEKEATMATEMLFSKFDKDKDGTMDQQEFKLAIAELRYELDEKREREKMHALPPSLVGRQMVDVTTKRVILLVLALLLFLPLVSPTDGPHGRGDEPVPGVRSSGLAMLHSLGGGGYSGVSGGSGGDEGERVSESVLASLVRDFVAATASHTLYLQLQGGDAARTAQWVTEGVSGGQGKGSTWSWLSLEQLEAEYRATELEQTVLLSRGCTPSSSSSSAAAAAAATGAVGSSLLSSPLSVEHARWFNCSSMAVFDTRAYSQEQARLSLYQTLFVMVMLCVGTATLWRDTNSLVISPIERMVHLVQRLAMDPLARITVSVHQQQPAPGPPTAMVLASQQQHQQQQQRQHPHPAHQSYPPGASGDGHGHQLLPSHLRHGHGAQVRPFDRGSSRNILAVQQQTAHGQAAGGRLINVNADRSGSRQQASPTGDGYTSKTSSWSGSVIGGSGSGRGGGHGSGGSSHHHSAGTYETHLLESTLTKIAGLVQIGFGSAGAAIIKQNMSHGGAFDPMVRGRKVLAVFGFCDIRKFTDATECLQEEVMVFTNKIGAIVHSAVHHFEGAANKNIGDAFLLVWKIPKGSREERALVGRLAEEEAREEAEERQRQRQQGGSVGAGAAGAGAGLHGIVKQLIELGEDGEEDTASADGDDAASGADAKSGADADAVAAVAGDAHSHQKQLQQQQQTRRRQQYQFHQPSMADNALAAFIKVMVDIRNSDELAAYRDNRLLMKRFDYPYVVKLGYGLHVGWAIEGAIGSVHKIDASYLSPDVNMSSRLEAATKQFGVPLLLSHRFYTHLSPWNRKLARCIDCVTVKGSAQPLGLYTCDVTRDRILRMCSFEDMELIQEGMHPDFRRRFRKGVCAYLRGEWAEARALLEEARPLKPEDGPLHSLLRVIDQSGGRAPDGWRGYRELTEK